ncbi:MAG TPA: transposase [Ktedonobacteraceae bacterium]|nr:transposase [Ktedonobacteraceae bacterium]
MQKKTRKQYSTEFKVKVVKEMLREEKTVGQLAAEYGVHSNMLYRWRDQALAGLTGLFSDQAAQELAQIASICNEIREAAHHLYAQGQYPTEWKIRRIITTRGAFKIPEVREAWKNLLRELDEEV